MYLAAYALHNTDLSFSVVQETSSITEETSATRLILMKERLENSTIFTLQQFLATHYQHIINVHDLQ